MRIEASLFLLLSFPSCHKFDIERLVSAFEHFKSLGQSHPIGCESIVPRKWGSREHTLPFMYHIFLF